MVRKAIPDVAEKVAAFGFGVEKWIAALTPASPEAAFASGESRQSGTIMTVAGNDT